MVPIHLTIILLAAAIHSSTAGIQQHRGSSHSSLRDVSGLSRALEADRPRNSASNDEDADFIIGDAVKLSKFEGETNPLSIHSFTAFPIVTDFFPDTKVTHTLLAGGRLGKGKIIGGADPKFFNKAGDPDYKGDEIVLLNALKWLSKDSAPKKVGIIKSDKDLEKLLRVNGIEAVEFSLEDITSAANLADFDVLFLVFSSRYSENDMDNLDLVSEYVKNGGGVLALTSSRYKEFKPFPEKSALNKLTAPAGFVWTQQKTEGQPQKSDFYTLSKGTPSKTKTAMDAAKDLRKRKCKTDDPDFALLTYVYSATPMGTPVYPGTDLEQLVQEIALKDQPLPSKDGFVRAVSTTICTTKRFHKIMETCFLKRPESVVVHPTAKDFPGLAATATRGIPHLVEYYNISLEPLKNFKDYTGVKLDIDNSLSAKIGISTKESVATEKSNYWLSTGRYLNAGDKGQITILNRNYNFDQLEVLVGAHTDSLHHDEISKWYRFPQVSMTYNFYDGVSKFSSPYGGLVYIKVPYFLAKKDLDVSNLKLSFQGDFVQAPVFNSDSMDNAAWKAERSKPAPWAELGNNRLNFIVSSSKVRTLDDPVGLMKFWDEVMDAFSDLLGLPKVLYRPQRICEDIQVGYGAYMHASYPIVVPLEEGTNALSIQEMKKPRDGEGGAACWGHFHELGHNFQDEDWWSPEGATSDVTNNIMTTYVCQHVAGVAPEQAHGHNTFEVYTEDIKRFIQSGKKNWLQDFWTGLQFYMHLQRTYDWGFYKKFFASYVNNNFDKPKGNVDIMSLSLEVMSRAAGKNLVDYFDSWNVEVSDEAREKVTKMGLPMSGLKVEDMLSK